jgi:large subunit ribosomal protein L24
MALHVKREDTVEIIAGDHKGATGRVLHVYPKKQQVIVQGHNLAKKHVRPSQRNPQGGRINVERPIHISNVMPVNPKSSKGVKVKYKTEADGTKKRVGIDGTEIDTVKHGKKK